MQTSESTIEDECQKLQEPAQMSISHLYDTLYKMMFWRSLGLPPPDIVSVAIAVFIAAASIVTASVGYLWFSLQDPI